MEIERIDGDRGLGQKVERIEVIVDGVRYTIMEKHGKLNIHAHEDSIAIFPCCANEVDVQ